MTITYMVITMIVTYAFGAITKAFIDNIPNKFIPLQNVIVGIISALICYFTAIEPNLLQAIILCIIASASAGGVADLTNIGNK